MVFMAECEADRCDNCLCNLDKCKASCCRTLSLPLKQLGKVRDGDKVTFGIPAQRDMIRYMKYHGARYIHGTISLVIRNPRIIGESIVFDAKCEKLGDDNLCKVHETKPAFCRGLDHNTAKSKKYFITEGCIYGDKR